MCVFVCKITCTATCTFNKFLYFLSTHQTNVIKFLNCFFFISYIMLQLSSVDVCIDRKNQMYTQYYSYHNVSPLHRKILGMYIILLNPKLKYVLICSLTAIYFEVQLCTTCKAANYRNNIHKSIHNLLYLLYLWIASLLFIVTSHENVIINFNEISQYCYPVCIMISFNINSI